MGPILKLIKILFLIGYIIPRYTSPPKKNEFCVKNHIVPSVFVIGIEKCGTSTLDAILTQFPDLSHGTNKEHMYFDVSHEPYSEYLKQFPYCNTDYNIQTKTHDATPRYANPLSNAPMNISRFYNYFEIPLKKLTFIAMACSNARRLPSIFYHLRSNGQIKPNTKLNEWFEMALKCYSLGIRNPMDNVNDPSKPNYELSRIALSMGFYGSIFKTYFELFNESKFIFIDSDYAFMDMQKVGDFLAKELNLKRKRIRYVHKNDHKSFKNIGKVETLTAENSERLKEFYSLHERKFRDMMKNNVNLSLKTYPSDNFLEKWT